jgi:hypothetical protein
MDDIRSTQPDDELQECIDLCLDCYRVCLDTIQHCLERGGRQAEAAHIRLLGICAEICQTSAAFMLSRTDLHTRTCAVCAEVCDRCAADCERFADDPTMRACADVCRVCATVCRRMAGGVLVSQAA